MMLQTVLPSLVRLLARARPTLFSPNSCQCSKPMPKDSTMRHRLARNHVTCCLQYVSLLSPYLLRVFSIVALKENKGEKNNKEMAGLKSFYTMCLGQNFPAPSGKVTGIPAFSGQGSPTILALLRGRQSMTKMSPLSQPKDVNTLSLDQGLAYNGPQDKCNPLGELRIIFTFFKD